MNFAYRLKEARNDANITQKMLEDMVGIHYVTLSKYEAGKTEPRIGDVVKLAKALNTTVSYLAGEGEIRHRGSLRKKGAPAAEDSDRIKMHDEPRLADEEPLIAASRLYSGIKQHRDKISQDELVIIAKILSSAIELISSGTDDNKGPQSGGSSEGAA